MSDSCSCVGAALGVHADDCPDGDPVHRAALAAFDELAGSMAVLHYDDGTPLEDEDVSLAIGAIYGVIEDVLSPIEDRARAAEAERLALQRQVFKLASMAEPSVLIAIRPGCLWCDWQGEARERPDAGGAQLRAHVAVCPGHPMRVAEAERDALRAALVAIRDRTNEPGTAADASAALGFKESA